MKQQNKDNIPRELDEIIKNSIDRGANTMKLKKYSITSSLIVMIAFVACMNMSATFAEAVGKLPVIGQALSVFNFDKGLNRAEENGYIQNIGKTVELEGFNFTLDRAVADKRRIVVECTVEDLNGILEGKEAEDISAYIDIHGWSESGWGGQYWSEEYNMIIEKIEDNKYKVTKDMLLSRYDEMPKNILVELVSISIREELYNFKQVYRNPENVNTLDEYGIKTTLKDEFLGDYVQKNKTDTFTLAGIEYKIDEISISPASTSVILSEIGYGDTVIVGQCSEYSDSGRSRSDNEEFWLEDEKGNRYNVIWSKIKTRYRKGGVLKKYSYLELKFESAYYNKPERLSIKGRMCIADKKEGEIVIDLKDKKVLAGDIIQNGTLNNELTISDSGFIEIKLGVDKANFDFYKKYYDYRLLKNGEDENGKLYKANSSIMSDFDYEIIKRKKPDYERPIEISIFCQFTGAPEVLEEDYFQNIKEIRIPTKYKNFRYEENIDVKLFEKK